VEMLEIKPIKALDIVTNHKKFSEVPSTLVLNNFELCTQNNLSKGTVVQYPYILFDGNLLKKLELLKLLPIKLISTVPLVKLSTHRLNIICLKHKTETTAKISNLCSHFNLSQNEICEILAARPFLLAINTVTFEELLNILTDNEISKEEILKDLWILKYSKSFIKNRLQLIKKHKVVVLKTWMLRCPEEILFRHIKKETDHKNILGEHSVAEYLSERLKCSENLAKYLIRKHPALETKSLTKMNEMIDFLCNNGFTPSQISRFPKVLLHSSKTAEIRLKEITGLGKKPDSLYVLTKSQRQYLQYLENTLKVKQKGKDVTN